jgi:hypothetical protein
MRDIGLIRLLAQALLHRRQNACTGSRQELPIEPGRSDALYLRAAQAYMLISMPTGTSTILGVFQVIPFSQAVWRELHAGFEPRTTPDIAQVDRASNTCRPGLQTGISLLDTAISLLDKIERRSVDRRTKPHYRASGDKSWRSRQPGS